MVPHGYCTECQARVTVVDGVCLLDHPIDPATINDLPGRRRARRHGSHSASPETKIQRAPTQGHRSVSVTNPTYEPHPSATHQSATYDTLEQALVVWSELDVVELPAPPTAQVRTPQPAIDPKNAFTRPVSDRMTATQVLPAPASTVDPATNPIWAEPQDPFVGAPPTRPGRKSLVGLTMMLTLILLLASFMIIGGPDDLTAVDDSAGHLAEVLGDLVAAGPVDRPLPELDQAARALFSDATQLQEGTAARALALDASARSLEIERSLGASGAYRASFEVTSPLPSLPTEATIAELSDISERYTAWATAMRQLLTEAPSDPSYSAFRAQASTAAAALDAIGSSYLDALRDADASTATGARDQARALVSNLTSSLGEAEAGLETWLETAVQDVASSLAQIGTSQNGASETQVDQSE